LLAQRGLIPAAAVRDETTWGIMLAGSAAIIALIAARPRAALPLAALAIAAYMAGTPVLTTEIRVLFAQVVVVCAIMELLRRGGRQADALIWERDRERHRARIAAAHRADERHHRAQMHDSVLAVLSMIAAAGPRGGPEPGAVAEGARHALEVLERPAPPARPGHGVDLRERLETAAGAATRGLTVERYGDGPVLVPEPVGAAVADAVGEALRNVARHAGTDTATVRTMRRDGIAIVEVGDRGRGFDPGRVPGARQGIRRSIEDRMTLVGGGATVRSWPGAGTRVVLTWPHV
jgi:two-component system NarL family sensor kinase